MKPIHELPGEACRNLRGVLFDIDDTFTLRGKILPEAFAVLWRLKEAGLAAVPITGRPAGWADHIARMWPVDGVVAENGAVAFRMDPETRALRKRFFVEDPARRLRDRKTLESIFLELEQRLPRAAPASDQPYRECDFAVDFCEDVSPPLTLDDAETIRAFFAARGAHAKISSIHVNAWFGDYDKLVMCGRFVREALGLSLEEERERFLFIGDSPNDSPMFSFFPLSAGVAGVRRFLEAGLLDPPPAFVSTLDGSLGFAEIAGHVLASRR